jgi:hypothetical protein
VSWHFGWAVHRRRRASAETKSPLACPHLDQKDAAIALALDDLFARMASLADC